MKKRILAIIMTLAMAVALSATAFADGPQGGFNQTRQMGGPQNGGPQSGMQMNGGSQNGMRMNGAPQGESGQQPPEKPEGDEDRTPPSGGESGSGQSGPMNGQQPPEKPEGDEDRTPPSGEESMPGAPAGNDPINRILSAVSELEDGETKSNIENLMEAHRAAVDAERNATDDDSRAEAAEAVAATQDALNEALAAAGIEVTLETPEQGSQQPQERPERERPAEGGQSEGGQQIPADIPQETEDSRDLFSLFQQFLEWLKNNSEE